MRAVVLAIALAVASSLIALFAFGGSAAATCAVGAQYDEYGGACPSGGSGGSQYTPPGSGGSQYDQYGGGGVVTAPALGAVVQASESSSQRVASTVDSVGASDVIFGTRQWRSW